MSDDASSPGGMMAGDREATPAMFGRIAVVGVGLIGASVAMAARRANPAAFLVGVDSAEVARRALDRGIVDVASDRLDVVAEADLVVLAAPVLQIIALIPQVARHVSARTVVTDVGSTKRAVTDAANAVAGRLTFVGGHPLAGAAAEGLDHARADLFAGRRWIFTPAGAVPHEAIDRLFAFAKSLGAEPRAVSAAEHDRVMAFVSHLPQLAASALMRVAAEGAGESGATLAGPGLADTTRLADSPFGIWVDVCATNADEIGAALDRLIAELAAARAGLAEPDRLVELFDRARSGRAWLPSVRATSRSAPAAS